jgi:site-specific DNA recombinase
VNATTVTREDTVRAALYQRVSSRDQSAARQAAENLAACEMRGWQPTVYVDDGLSASRFAGRKGGAARADHVRLRADIAAGRIDMVVFWEVSRGDRQLTGWSGLLDACRATGTLIYITSEDAVYDVRTPRDWKALAEAGIDAVLESEKLSMRIKSGKAEGVREGRPQGSVAFGIHRVRDPERTKRAFIRDEPDPETGPVVQEIIRRVGDREAYVDIARSLNARGVRSPKGGEWTRTSIVRIADNPAYVAAGVVTQSESNAARARISEGRGQGSGSGERPNAAKLRYSGTMKCSICGEPVQGHCPYYAPAGRYQCKGTKHAVRTAKGTAWIDAARADEWLDHLAIEWLSQPLALALLEAGDDAGARQALDEAEGYDLQVRQAKAEAESGNLDPDELMMKIAAVKGWARKAEEARKRAEQLATPSPLAGLPDEDRAVVEAHWEALSLGARKAAVRVIMPNMVLLPGGQDVPVDQRIKPEPEVTER